MKKPITHFAKGLALGLFLLPLQLLAQQTLSGTQSEVKVKGTSTLHDWEMSAKNVQIKATPQWEGQKLVGLHQVTLQLAPTALKSDNSGLDKNAYKALMTDKYTQIQCVLQQTTLTPTGEGQYKVVGTGQLTIAGQTKKVTLQATAQVAADKSIRIKGQTSFNMSEYGVKPPTVMMGTIKTGDKITIEYQTKLQ
jgi:polyisoprenoid-binding protein YceI